MNDAVHANGLTAWEVREQTTGSVFTHPRPQSCGHTLPNAHSHARALVRARVLTRTPTPTCVAQSCSTMARACMSSDTPVSCRCSR